METINPLEIRKHLLEEEGFKIFNNSDFACYSSAQSFSDESRPIIKRTSEYDIIFDAQGFYFDAGDKFVNYSLNK